MSRGSDLKSVAAGSLDQRACAIFNSVDTVDISVRVINSNVILSQCVSSGLLMTGRDSIIANTRIESPNPLGLIVSIVTLMEIHRAILSPNFGYDFLTAK